jgi:hypothetical protein
MELANRFVIPIILFILTLVFGFWLSHVGKPYNGLLFNIHKLIALVCVVLLGIQFSKTIHAPNWLIIAFLVVSALCVSALFVSGALMSAGKLEYNLMLAIHRVAPFVLVVGLGMVMVLLKSSSS